MLANISPTKKAQKQLASSMKKFQEQVVVPKIESAPLLPRNPDLGIAVIVDIDGTLAVRGKRGIFDFVRSIDDEVAFPIVYFLRLIDDANKYISVIVPTTEIIIITGREDCYRDVTNKWLNRHQIPYTKMYMRRTGDKRKSNIVKEDIYISMIRDKYNVLCVFEDRQQDLDMYRSHGLYSLVADNTREHTTE